MNRQLALTSFITVLISTFSASAVDAAAMLAFYEIKAEVNGNSSVIRTSKPVEFGTAITHEFGEYQLSMLFELAEADQFTLTASLNSIAPSTNSIIYTVLSESFSGQISTAQNFGQSAYTIEENEISISITLSLSQID